MRWVDSTVMSLWIISELNSKTQVLSSPSNAGALFFGTQTKLNFSYDPVTVY